MIDAVRRAITPMARRVMASTGRCRVQNSDDSTGRQRLQVTGLPGEVLSEVETIQHYGLASSPLPGALAVVQFPAGARDSGIVVGTEDSRYRPVGLAPGEVCLYNFGTGQVLLQADGSVIIFGAAAGVTIKAATFAVTGNQTVSGNMAINGSGNIHGTFSVGGDLAVSGVISADNIVNTVNGMGGDVDVTPSSIGADAAGAAAAVAASLTAFEGTLGTASTAALVTTLGTPGSDTNVASEKAVRTAIDAATGLRFQPDSWAVVGTAYALTQAPNGTLIMVFFDGVLQPSANYSYAASVLTLAGGVDLTAIATVSAVYTF